MPPRARARAGGQRGAGRGQPQPAAGRGQPQPAAGRGQPQPQPAHQAPPAHITTVGVRRPGYGFSGKSIRVNVNSFTTKVQGGSIFHYDVVISGGKMPVAFNMRLIKALQEGVAPTIFADRVVFDGRKNLFSPVDLQLEGDSQEFDVGHPDQQVSSDRPPRIYKIKLKKVATINKEILDRFINGQQSQDDTVNTTLMALNVVLRMEPAQRLSSQGRSFFTSEGSRNIGGGLSLWRGYFQSLRPGPERMLVNIDTSTGLMYQSGPLISLCLSVLGLNPRNPSPLTKNLEARDRRKLASFITGIRVATLDASSRLSRARVVRELSKVGADEFMFTMRDGRSRTITQYYQATTGRPLKYPSLLCVKVGSVAFIPLELCDVLPGQLAKEQVPEDKKTDVVKFATMRPEDRLASIRRGIEVLAYGQSEYVRKFGLEINPEPLSIQARILPAPTLKYGPGSKTPTVGPVWGAWNMADKKLYRPATITTWVLILFDFFSDKFKKDLIRDFVAGCRSTGIIVADPDPIVWNINGQSDIPKHLLDAGNECFATKKVAPKLFVVILPENGNVIYTIVKHWGDVSRGVATQCLKKRNCTGANLQFWANVALKVNVKLGGINVITDATRSPFLSDPRNPVVVMGADVMHPAPGTTTRPSYAAVVSSVDSNAAKYVAELRVQASRQELITDLKKMAIDLLNKHKDYRREVEKADTGNQAPKRLVFYRDGVSEGQFQQVLDEELPQIKAACQEVGINPRITLVVVGKRHHIRLFPINAGDADRRSGNCPPGTVVDRDIGHPTEFDFYLQSHTGILGTSRPGHYSVLYDENNLTADAMQALSFALCHVYAASTRSVSIPAPVYYADKVCARAKNHFDPAVRQGEWSESGSVDAATTLEQFQHDYQPLHEAQSRRMYFS